MSARRGHLIAYAIALIAGLIVLFGLRQEGQTSPQPAQDARVFALDSPRTQSGLEVLLGGHTPELRGLRVGLVCNHTAVDTHKVHAIDRLRAAGIDLVALYSPEHGIKGRIPNGQIADSVDPESGLPIWSLYGETRKPTPAMLAGVDLMLFDLQDVGARFYTYASTLKLVMEAAGEQGIPVWVLDRPNPLGGELVQGPLLDPKHASFLGYFPIPIRHGMTMGELAQMYVGEFGVRCDLRVVPMAGWRRSMEFEATGLPWVPPSPSMWTSATAKTYPGLCFFEGSGCSIGGSTYKPYEVVGAPWLTNHVALAEQLNARALPGARFTPIRYTPVKPNDGKYAGEECLGIEVTPTDSAAFDPVLAGLALFQAVARAHPDKIGLREAHFQLLSGQSALLEALMAGEPVEDFATEWRQDCAAFERLRAPYLLYD